MMYDMFRVLMMGIFTIIISLITTPLVKKFAFFIGAVDHPDKRRVNEVTMPSIGGLAIYISFFLSIFFLQPISRTISVPIFFGATIIILTGIFDDIRDISPKTKLAGIIAASLVVYFFADVQMNSMTLPFFGLVGFGYLSLPVTLIWILAITNAINLIDGLDGLASGVSMIALGTMSIISFFFLGGSNIPVFIMIFTLIAAILGFFPYNFFPAKIYLGDTGALFLGFMVSVFSLYGLKNVTIVSLIIPITILGIPITDTIYAILRRRLNKLPLSGADKNHMHHRLMSLGLTHKQTVLLIYAIALIFSIIALLFSLSTIWGFVFISIGLLLGIELFVEIIGLVGIDRRPLIDIIEELINRKNKQ